MAGDDIQAARNFAERIVLAQGNRFIKELLRQRGLKIGTTKTEFLANLSAAIAAGQLPSDDLASWLSTVEGWGDHHVYLYRVPREVLRDPVWTSPQAMRRKLAHGDAAALWGNAESLEFPPEFALTGISFRDGILRFVWHRGFSNWVREAGRDRHETIDDDYYEFRAYRQRYERSVMRFEVRTAERLAAAFLQIPLADGHPNAMKWIWDAAAPVLSQDKLRQVNVSKAIKNLDQSQLTSGSTATFTAQQTRLSGQGAYVEFGSTSDDWGYRDVEPIRDIRQALQPDRVSGERATMHYTPPAELGPVKEHIRVWLNGPERRIQTRAQMTEGQVWHLLKAVAQVG